MISVNMRVTIYLEGDELSSYKKWIAERDTHEYDDDLSAYADAQRRADDVALMVGRMVMQKAVGMEQDMLREKRLEMGLNVPSY